MDATRRKMTTTFCPNCNYVFPYGNFCKICGTKLVEPPPKRPCPECGEVSRSDAAYCCNCGVKLDGDLSELADVLRETPPRSSPSPGKNVKKQS